MSDEREKVATIIMEHYDAHPRSVYGTDAHGLADRILAALRAPEGRGDVGPSAWRWRQGNQSRCLTDYNPARFHDDLIEVTPLYTLDAARQLLGPPIPEKEERDG